MKLKGDAKFKGKMTCDLKNDFGNLVNFHARSQKYGNLHFDGLLLSKAHKDLDEKVQKNHVSCLLSEVVQIRRLIFETRSQFLYKLCTILYYLS